MSSTAANSAGAFRDREDEGVILTQRQRIVEVLREFGPMCDGRIDAYLKTQWGTSAGKNTVTRRKELCDEGIVGIMTDESETFQSEYAAQMWGLIEDHGADPYRPDDFIQMRLGGITVREGLEVGDDDEKIMSKVPMLREFIRIKATEQAARFARKAERDRRARAAAFKEPWDD